MVFASRAYAQPGGCITELLEKSWTGISAAFPPQFPIPAANNHSPPLEVAGAGAGVAVGGLEVECWKVEAWRLNLIVAG